MPISILSPLVANQIAAGEVIDRPAAVVKELIENALDAGASEIRIEIENGGVDLIRITDNGCGIPDDECELAFVRHATSKITEIGDLDSISTLGFRGEALASICSVAQVELHTKTGDSEIGTRLLLEHGKVLIHEPYACNEGTSLTVRQIFKDIPARLKYLKTIRSEAGYISEYVAKMIMARPDAAFSYTNNDRTVYRSYGDRSLKNAISCVYGTETADNLIPVEYDDGYLAISGFLGNETISKPNRSQQSFFVNGRSIRSINISSTIQRAYETRLTVGKFPFAVLHFTIAANEVDVNVHPTKQEVRFLQEQRVLRTVFSCCQKAVIDACGVPELQIRSGILPGNTAPAVHPYPDRLPVQRPISSGGVRLSDSDYGTPAPHRFREQGGGYRQTGNISDTIRDLTRSSLYPEDTAERPIAQPWSMRHSDTKADLMLNTGEEYTVIGQVFSTYLLVQRKEDLLVIDQHAAHERILFEQLMNRETELVSQSCAVPLRIILDEKEFDIAERHRSLLTEFGFELQLNEQDLSAEFSALPQLKGRTYDITGFREILQHIEREGTLDPKAILREKIMQSACKHAIKAGEPLPRDAVRSLLKTYAEEGIPMTCPHGRPVMFILRKSEIEKMFMRT